MLETWPLTWLNGHFQAIVANFQQNSRIKENPGPIYKSDVLIEGFIVWSWYSNVGSQGGWCWVTRRWGSCHRRRRRPSSFALISLLFDLLCGVNKVAKVEGSLVDFGI